VRNETQVGSSSVSVASVAVELAKKIFGSLEGKHVFLVGAGKMSELAAKHLLAHGAGSIFVANRTHDRAVELAGRFQGEAIRFDELYDTADRADIVISSTGAPHAIFRREHGVKFLQRRKNRPMFFIDIAVPRDVDPEMNRLDGIFVYDIDDLQSVVASNLSDRKSEADRAEQIVEAEVDRCLARFNEKEIVPTIVSLQEQIETIRQAEIDRARGRLGAMTPEQEMAVDALTKAIVNKILHTPITTLKSAAREAEANTLEENYSPHLQPENRSSQERPARIMAKLRIGSRGSQLALWQANHVAALLRERGHEVSIKVIKTTGDKITEVALSKVGTKGMFTKEIEEALAEKRIDLAVHSLKDLPTELSGEFLWRRSCRGKMHAMRLSRRSLRRSSLSLSMHVWERAACGARHSCERFVRISK